MKTAITALLAILLAIVAFAAAKPRVRDATPEERERLLQELKPTLDRIARNEHFPHRNDGAVFQNREGRLPLKPRAYYREYVHPTPGLPHAGTRRVITGKNGELYYTADHYENFVRIR